MTGYVRQKHNVPVAEKRVGAALSVVSPQYTAQRRTSTTRAVNPIPYRADYFGHKLHIDQNEKLVMYGVTHVAAIDGHSRFVVAGTTMPVKNNLTIYKEIYKYGMHLFSFVKCTRSYFLMFCPSFDALLSCFSGQVFYLYIFLMLFPRCPCPLPLKIAVRTLF